MKPVDARSVRTSKTMRTLAIVIAYAGTVGLSSCATVDPEPFKAFAKSAQQLQTGAESAVGAVAPLEQEFVKVTAAKTGPELGKALERIRIEVVKTTVSGDVDTNADSPFTWNLKDAPLFLEAERFRAAIGTLNAAFVKYAGLLVQLSSPGLITNEQFTRLSTDLNNNTFSAVTALTGKTPDPNAVALFSTAAAALAQAYIESRRKEDLVKALKVNQSNVEAFAGHGQSAARILANLRARSYVNESQAIIDQIAMLLGPGKETQRESKVQDLITLDRTYIEALGALGSLNDAYGKIPAAHQELRAAVQNPDLSLVSILAVSAEAKRLETQFQTSRLANQARADQAAADAAKARAEALAEQATAAREEATKARLAADAVPGDPAKATLAADLERAATELGTQARAASTAVTAAQAKADASKAAAAAAGVTL